MPEWIPPDRVEDVARAIEANAVPIVGLRYHTLLNPNRRSIRGVLAFVDTSRRPDVRRMIAAHRSMRDTEQGDVMTRWGLVLTEPNLDSLRVSIELRASAPVTCAFNLVFPTNKASTRAWLTTADRLGWLGITDAPLDTYTGRAMLIELGGTTLKTLLVDLMGLVKTAQNWRWN